MGKESKTKWVAKIALGEVSKSLILIIFGALNMPLLLTFLTKNTQMHLHDITTMPILGYTLSTKLLLLGLLLSFLFLFIVLVIIIHKHFVRKREFFLFFHNNYLWKLKLPEKRLDSNLPYCPEHGVKLTNNSNGTIFCPFCDISITGQLYEQQNIIYKAESVGVAMYDGHYKAPKKKFFKSLFNKCSKTV